MHGKEHSTGDNERWRLQGTIHLVISFTGRSTLEWPTEHPQTSIVQTAREPSEHATIKPRLSTRTHTKIPTLYPPLHPPSLWKRHTSDFTLSNPAPLLYTRFNPSRQTLAAEANPTLPHSAMGKKCERFWKLVNWLAASFGFRIRLHETGSEGTVYIFISLNSSWQKWIRSDGHDIRGSRGNIQTGE